MATHILSLTYQPKIEPVFNGDCTQTIRLVRSDAPWRVGDKAILHTWKGLPYRTPWARRLDTILSEVHYIYLERGQGWKQAVRPFQRLPSDQDISEAVMDQIAERDGIIPPTASCLINTLMALNNLSYEMFYEAMFRIIRWPKPTIRRVE